MPSNFFSQQLWYVISIYTYCWFSDKFRTVWLLNTIIWFEYNDSWDREYDNYFRNLWKWIIFLTYLQSWIIDSPVMFINIFIKGKFGNMFASVASCMETLKNELSTPNADDYDIYFLTLLTMYRIWINKKVFTVIIIIEEESNLQELAFAVLGLKC